MTALSPGLFVVGFLTVVAVFVAWAFGFGKPDPNRWYGKMTCLKCGYL